MFCLCPTRNKVYLFLSYVDRDKQIFLNSLATQFYMPDDVPRTLGHFRTGCIVVRLSSLRRVAWRHNGSMEATSLKLVEVLSIFCPTYTWYKVFVSDSQQIRIDHDRSGVTSIKPLFAVRRWRPCAGQESPVCCWRYFLPTVTNPLDN